MNDLIVKINKSTRKVILEQIYIGNDHENLQEKLVFEFEDEFVNGQGRLEYEIDGDKNYIILQKEGETYTIPVQNVITIYQEETAGKIKFQLVVTEGTEQENIPVFKSNIFFLKCRPSINAVTEAPEGYDLWIEQANAKLNAMDEALTEVDNLDIDANKVGKVTSIIITKKDGTQKTINVDDGVSLEYLWQGTSLGIKREDEQNYVFVNLKGEKGDKGEAGAIKMIIVNELPETGANDTIYLVPYTIVTVQELPETGNLDTIYIVEGTGKRYVYESSQWIEIRDNNKYIEYVYVNNAWEKLGGIQVQVDLTDYVKNTDYARTDKGGTFKVLDDYGTYMINGVLSAQTKNYTQYQLLPNQLFIGKGTLENVLTEKIGTIDTILETLTVGSGV